MPLYTVTEPVFSFSFESNVYPVTNGLVDLPTEFPAADMLASGLLLPCPPPTAFPADDKKDYATPFVSADPNAPATPLTRKGKGKG